MQPNILNSWTIYEAPPISRLKRCNGLDATGPWQLIGYSRKHVELSWLCNDEMISKSFNGRCRTMLLIFCAVSILILNLRHFLTVWPPGGDDDLFQQMGGASYVVQLLSMFGAAVAVQCQIELIE